MANTTLAKITITKENADKLITSVKKEMALINKGYLAVAPDVAKLYDTHAYEVLGYQNFDALCINEFGMSHGTTVGIRKVFALYGSKSSKDGSYTIPDKYAQFGYTKLLLFATDAKKFKEAGIDPIEAFTPDMTIGEMKSHLKGLLEDKADKQDAEAIEGKASEVEDGSIIDNSDAEAKEVEAPTVDTFDTIMADAANIRTLFGDTKDAAVIAHLDSLEATIKELKKLYKKINK